MAQKIKRSPDEIVELQVEGQNVLNLQINQNTDVDISSPVSGQVLGYNGTQWTNQEATGKVLSVNGYTGTVVLTKSDVGLGNVDNTSDANKPISTATQASLATKYSLTNPPPYPVTSVNSKTGAVSLTTDNVPATTTNRYVPAVPTSNPDISYLNGNGVFSTLAVGGASSVANVFFSNTASTVSGYKTLNYVADATATELSVTMTSAADVLSAVYLYSAPLGTNVIDAGIWKSTIYAKTSVQNGINRLKFVCFVRHIDGTETDLFTGYSASVAQTTYGHFYTETNRQQFNVLATDTFGIRIYGNTDRTSSATIYYQIGGINGSYINTPLALRHTQLRDLNGDPSYQHIPVSLVNQITTNKQNIDTLNTDVSNLQSGLSAEITNRQNADISLQNQINTKLETNGDGSNITSTFSTTETFTNITSGSKLSLLFGKVYTAIGNLISHINNTLNPHNVTKAQVGLSNVANTLQYSASNPQPSVTGNAGTATALQTARTIAISGGATGTATSFDGTSNISIPVTSLDATKLTGTATVNTTGNAATATSLQTTRNINVDTAVSATPTSFDGSANITIPINSVYASYTAWGGRNLSGTVSPVDVAINNEFSSNRLSFMTASDILIEYSNDGGTTWVTYTTSDSDKQSLVTTYRSYSIGGHTSNVTTSDKLRITLTAFSGRLYTSEKQIQLNTSSNGSAGGNVTLEARTIGNYNNSVDTWNTLVSGQSISGWSGWNVLNIPFTFGGSTGQTSNYRQIRMTFGITAISTSYNSALQVLAIRLYGENLWSSTNTYQKTGHIYSFDMSQNAVFPAQVTSTQFNGALNGTATNATADASGNVITTTYAPKASPALTGTPTAPTATSGTSTTQIATTAFVHNAITSSVSGNVTYLSSSQPSSVNSGDMWYQIL